MVQEFTDTDDGYDHDHEQSDSANPYTMYQLLASLTTNSDPTIYARILNVPTTALLDTGSTLCVLCVCHLPFSNLPSSHDHPEPSSLKSNYLSFPYPGLFHPFLQIISTLIRPLHPALETTSHLSAAIYYTIQN
eukprot:GHVP01047852.1.p1 GENE.GHVP01047852.1~~GHVP01047852.1.p1  ORF type:complete len:134 (-),score=4.29 GHVP01047852.1:202-603(-)